MPKDKKPQFPKGKPQKDSSEDAPRKTAKNYPLRGALIFLISHIMLAIFITVWGFEKSMFMVQGGHFFLYLVELPGVELTKLLGEAENLEVIAPYAITFFTNTILYALIGYGIGHLFQRLGWIEETDDIFLNEEELTRKELTPPE